MNHDREGGAKLPVMCDREGWVMSLRQITLARHQVGIQGNEVTSINGAHLAGERPECKRNT